MRKECFETSFRQREISIKEIESFLGGGDYFKNKNSSFSIFILFVMQNPIVFSVIWKYSISAVSNMVTTSHMCPFKLITIK